MNKFRWLLLPALTALTLSAAPAPAASETPATPAAPAKASPQEWFSWLKVGITQERALQMLADAAAKLDQSNLSSFALRVQARRLQTLATYPFVEFDTKLDRTWLNKFAVAFTQLAEYKAAMFKLRHQSDSPEYLDQLLKYEQLAKAVRANLRKPVVVTDQARLNRLEAERRNALNRLQQLEQQKAPATPAPINR